MKLLKDLARLSALAFAGLLLWSCTVVVEEEPGRPLPPPPDGPRICTQQYQPVCATRGGREQTFPNACIAQSEGFRPVHPGECRPSRPPEMPPQACTREYRPVCAVDRGRFRTFGNACEADVAGWRIIRNGPC